jgi:hypothetical protein
VTARDKRIAALEAKVVDLVAKIAAVEADLERDRRAKQQAVATVVVLVML